MVLKQQTQEFEKEIDTEFKINIFTSFDKRKRIRYEWIVERQTITWYMVQYLLPER